MHVYTYVYIRVHVYTCVHMCISVYRYTYMYMCVYVPVYIPSVCACTHMYKYTSAHIHIHVNHCQNRCGRSKDLGLAPPLQRDNRQEKRIPGTFSVLPLIHYVAVGNSLGPSCKMLIVTRSPCTCAPRGRGESLLPGGTCRGLHTEPATHPWLTYLLGILEMSIFSLEAM